MNIKSIFLISFFIGSLSLVADSNVPVDENVQEEHVEIEWNRWTPDVFKRAKKQNRLVLVDFAADWCDFCKKMDMTTWRDPQVLESIRSHYIPVRVQDEIDPELAKKYRNYGRPAIVVLNGDGVEIIKKTGYLKPLLMHWMLEGVAQNPTPEANK